MSPSFLVKIICYTYRSFINKLASLARIHADDISLFVKGVTQDFNEERRRHLPDKVNFNLFYSICLPVDTAR
jgi:hypothetical protein